MTTGDGEWAELPELLPARMLNEYVYCPRLFYLEWVDDRWSDSADTEDGRFAHRAVDKPTGQLPDPEVAGWAGQARSIRLEDRELGVLAVIDRVEFSDGTVMPLEVKKGHPTPEGLPWPADRIQVLIHVVLLRRKGFHVPAATLYYAETNQRVAVEIGEDVEDEVRQLAAEARRTAGQLLPPLPLVSSPKCPRCSLVGLCLPDETNALLDRSALPPRRIVPRDPSQRPMYVTEQGAFVGVSGGRVVVKLDGQKVADVRLLDISHLAVYGRVQISADALDRLWTHGAPVLWFSFNGWLRGWAQGEPARYVELRRRQVVTHAQGGLGMARKMIEGKISNQRVLLRRNSRSEVAATVEQMGRLRDQARSALSAGELLGIEGTAARLYFAQFTSMITPKQESFIEHFDVNGRTRRPPTDPINVVLSYCYGLLVKDLVAVCLAVGLDPFIGVLHRPRFGRPSLALDLAEEFRPLVADSVVLQVINNGEVDGNDFFASSRGVTLTPNGRKQVIRAYERRLEVEITHPVFGYKISYRRVMDVQARLVAAVMIGEIPEYTAMVTR